MIFWIVVNFIWTVASFWAASSDDYPIDYPEGESVFGLPWKTLFWVTGCGIVGTVKLLDVGVPTTNLGAVRCGQARTYAQWARNAVAPAAYQILGSELAKVESMGSYACRNVAGTARRSGHSVANAIDVGGFQLKDGRRITILKDWNSPDPDVRRFLQTISSSACKRFGTVLGPNYNAAHRNHLHLEDDKANFCR